MTVKINKVDLCYDDMDYKYNVADIESLSWKMIGIGLLYSTLKNETSYSLRDCKSEIYVKFRAPKENENQDSMISIVKATAITPSGGIVIRTEEFDADRLSFSLPQGALWGKKAESANSQSI